MGLLVKAGTGYPVEPNMDVSKHQHSREGTAALPYAEISLFGTDMFNEIRLNRTHALRQNVSG